MPQRLALTVYAAHLPQHPDEMEVLRRYDRALCLTCYGTGVRVHERQVDACAAEGHATGESWQADAHCHPGFMVCERHRCRACLGDGVVCPHCRGARFIAEENLAAGQGVDIRACPTCCEGNNVNPTKEMRAIQLWLRRHCGDCGHIRGRSQMTTGDGGTWTPCPECGSQTTLLDVMAREAEERKLAHRTAWGGGSEAARHG